MPSAVHSGSADVVRVILSNVSPRREALHRVLHMRPLPTTTNQCCSRAIDMGQHATRAPTTPRRPVTGLPSNAGFVCMVCIAGGHAITDVTLHLLIPSYADDSDCAVVMWRCCCRLVADRSMSMLQWSRLPPLQFAGLLLKDRPAWGKCMIDQQRNWDLWVVVEHAQFKLPQVTCIIDHCFGNASCSLDIILFLQSLH